MSTSGKMAVVNMKSLSFKWVTGFPEDVNSISIGFPDNADGKIYVPVSGASSMHGGGSGGGNRVESSFRYSNSYYLCHRGRRCCNSGNDFQEYGTAQGNHHSEIRENFSFPPITEYSIR